MPVNGVVSALISAALYVALLVPSPARAAEVTLYILAGQSNMDGRGKASKLSDAQKTTRAGVEINYHHSAALNSGGWVPLKPGYSVTPGYTGGLPSPTFGPELTFADRLRELRPDQRLVLLKVSQGGTNLFSDWNPGNRPGESAGRMYSLLQDALKTATAQLTTRGDTYAIGGFLWHQGGSDAATRSREQYAADLTNLIAEVRKLTASPELPIIIAEQVHVPDGRYTHIIEAQNEVAAALSRTAIVTSQRLPVQSDQIHLTEAGLLDIGVRYADTLHTLIP